MPIYNAQILEIDAVETRRYAGLRKIPEFGEKNIREACEEALILLEVRGVWEIYAYDSENHTILSDLPFKIVGNSIVKHLNGCERVICLAATVGEAIEREITKKFERGEYLASILLDSAATSAVEQAADAMERNFAAKFAKDGYKMRWRYSPGYGDWNLTEQAGIFRLSGAETINLRLTEAFMLEPRKSVTAIIGLEKISAKKPSAGKKSCANCDKIDCAMRK